MNKFRENLDVFKWSNEGGEQKWLKSDFKGHFDEVGIELINYRQILQNKSIKVLAKIRT